MDWHVLPGHIGTSQLTLEADPMLPAVLQLEPQASLG